MTRNICKRGQLFRNAMLAKKNFFAMSHAKTYECSPVNYFAFNQRMKTGKIVIVEIGVAIRSLKSVTPHADEPVAVAERHF